jgi:predicted GIY-YIG superfamily endonuclease
MVFVYAIQLEQGKYYIGKTNNPKFRLESHFNSNAHPSTPAELSPTSFILIVPLSNL